MSDIVNLRRARKGKARTDAERAAAANRLAFGRTKADREATSAERALNLRRLDGHLRDVAPTRPETDAD